LLKTVHELDPALELKYNKFYIGLVKGGQPHNFIVLRPRKNSLILTIHLKQSPEVESRLEENGLDTLEYDKRGGGYRIRLAPDDLKKHGDVLKYLIGLAYQDRS